MIKPTIADVLAVKLGRVPTDAELCADVRRILGMADPIQPERKTMIQSDQWPVWIAQAMALPLADLRRHASVSRDNRHYCRQCFCCACLTVLRQITQAADRG